MKFVLNIVFSLLFSLSAYAQKAVLIEDGNSNGSGDSQDNPRQETKRGSFFAEKKSLQEVFYGDYNSTFDMRAKRRVGVGFEVAGNLGMLGVQAELNFTQEESAFVGFGGGPQYSSFSLGWRHVFGGRYLAPFAGMGYSRWYNSTGGSSIWNTTPQFLGQKFLTGYEQEVGKFSLNLFTPEAGLQYNVLSGPYAGTSIYAKALLLMNLSNLQNVITGAFGMNYYF